jgi:uncharacterized membrane protein YfcA
MHFPASGVDCPVWAPPLVAFGLALVTTPAGVSGAFLLLPFQMSVLGFVTPGVTPTNLIYNVIAIPGGVYRYTREGRMVWPLAAAIIAGTLPGMFLGAYVRVHYLPDPKLAKLFVAVVLAYIGARLLCDRPRNGDGAESLPRGSVITTARINGGRLEFEFRGRQFSISVIRLMLLALLVGVIGGIYGVGGGAILAPYAVAILRLPAHTVAGACLASTLVTSGAGVGFFELFGHTPSGVPVRPDWALGALFGAGGLAGSYCGARLQKRLSERWIKLFLGVVVIGVALRYSAQFFT